MKFFNIFLLALIAPASSAFARYEVHNRTEKVGSPFTITLPYPASWKIGIGYEDRATFKNAICLQYPQPVISFDQEICALPAAMSREQEKYGIKSCTLTAHTPGAAAITFSLPYSLSYKSIPFDTVIIYQIDVLE